MDNFELESTNKDGFEFKDYKGKKLVIYFYPKTTPVAVPKKVLISPQKGTYSENLTAKFLEFQEIV